MFAECLGKLRRAKKMRQKEAAISAQLDPSYWAALENGRRIPPRAEVMTQILDALEATDAERSELVRAAALSLVQRAIDEHGSEFPGCAAAMKLLEISTVLSKEELSALDTLVEGYRYRTFLQRRGAM